MTSRMPESLTDDQLRDQAIQVLNEHLGPVDTMRFLSWLRAGPRDYQAWRNAHFAGFNVDDLIARMRELDAGAGAGPPNGSKPRSSA